MPDLNLTLNVKVDDRRTTDGKVIYQWLNASELENGLYVMQPVKEYESNIALEMVNHEFYDHEQMLYAELVKNGWVKWCDHHQAYCSATFGSHVIAGFKEMELKIDKLAASWTRAMIICSLIGMLIGSFMR